MVPRAGADYGDGDPALTGAAAAGLDVAGAVGELDAVGKEEGLAVNEGRTGGRLVTGGAVVGAAVVGAAVGEIDAVALGVGDTVGVGLCVGCACCPTFARGGNDSTCWPWRAWSMKALKIMAGARPP